MRHRAGEWVTIQEVLFPGYLFFETRHPEDLFTELVKVPAFTRLLGSEEAFVPLTPEEINFIQTFAGDSHIVEMSEGVIEGDVVRVTCGPLRDHEATIAKIDRHKRAAYVCMSMMGRETLVKLGLEIVRKV